MKVKIAILATIGLASAGWYESRLHAQEGAKSARDGVFTQEQADRGKNAYSQECAACHGGELGGGDVPPALVGATFLSNYETVGPLFDRIRVTMPANAKIGKLSRDMNADITAFILSYNGFPAGPAPLSTKTEVLNTIRIDPK